MDFVIRFTCPTRDTCPPKADPLPSGGGQAASGGKPVTDKVHDKARDKVSLQPSSIFYPFRFHWRFLFLCSHTNTRKQILRERVHRAQRPVRLEDVFILRQAELHLQ